MRIPLLYCLLFFSIYHAKEESRNLENLEYLEHCTSDGTQCSPYHTFSTKITDMAGKPGEKSCMKIIRESHETQKDAIKGLRLTGVDFIVGKDQVIPVPLTHPDMEIREETADHVDVCVPTLVGKNMQSRVVLKLSGRMAGERKGMGNPVFVSTRMLGTASSCPKGHRVNIQRGYCESDCAFSDGAVIAILVVSAVTFLMSILGFFFIY